MRSVVLLSCKRSAGLVVAVYAAGGGAAAVAEL
jgi:hypothetical protein